MKKVLGNLDKRWVRAASSGLCKQLDEFVESRLPDRIDTVLAWTSFFDGEVDLSQFISNQIEKREVYLPRSSADFKMTFVSIGKDWLEQVEQGRYGIPEPRLSSGKIFQPEDPSRVLVLVPGLAFDRMGNRIGRGKGYYDRFLAQSGLKGAIRIGIMWEIQFLESIPAEAHDIPMDWLCSEDRVLHTGLDDTDSADLNY